MVVGKAIEIIRASNRKVADLNHACIEENDSQHKDGLQAVAFSPDDRWLVSGEWKTKGDYKSRLLLWKVGDDREITFERQIPWSKASAGVMSLAFHPTDNLLTVGPGSRTVHMYTISNFGTVTDHGRQEFSGDKRSIGMVRSLDFSNDGKKLAAAGCKGPIQIWDLKFSEGEINTKPEKPLIGHAGGSQSLAFNPSHPVLASGGADGNVKLWYTKDLDHSPATLQVEAADTLSVTWNQNGNRLAASFTQTEDNPLAHGKILIWNWKLKDSAEIACNSLWLVSIDDKSLCSDFGSNSSPQQE